MRGAGWVGCVLALTIAAGLVLRYPETAWRVGADEGTYLRYASRIARDGLAALPSLTREHLEDPLTRATAPSPLRLAVVLPDALAVRLLGDAYPSLQRISLLALLALLVVAFVGFRRAAGAPVATAVALLLAVSPLQLGMARRALGDSLNTTLWTVSIFSYVEALASDRRRGWLAVAAAFAVTLLAKESNLALLPIALVLLAVDAATRRRAPSLLALACSTVLPFALATMATLLAAGGPATALESLLVTVRQASDNPYAIRFGSGPWYRYVVDFLLLSPWTLLLYVVWLGMLARTRRVDRRLLPWALLPILYLAALSPSARFVRWTMPLDVPIRLGTVLAIGGLLRGRLAPARVLAIGLVMLVDVRSFLTLFVTADIYDPTSDLLLWWRHFLP
jgi:hypothetical protein